MKRARCVQSRRIKFLWSVPSGFVFLNWYTDERYMSNYFPGIGRRLILACRAAGGLLFILSARIRAERTGDLNDVLRHCGLKLSAPLWVGSDFKRSSGHKTYDTIIASNTLVYVEIEISRPISHQQSLNYAKSKYTILRSL